VKPTRISLLTLIILAPCLLAQEADHKTGVTFSVGQATGELSFRRVLTPRWAALGVLGYSTGTAYAYAPSPATQGPVDVSTWSVGLSGRRYVSAAPIRPFLEAGGGIRWSEFAGCDIQHPYGTAGGGVEYAIAPRVSIEGSTGLTYTSHSQRCTNNGVEYRYEQDSLSTFRTALSITFYF
jgi:hypothetical protein